MPLHSILATTNSPTGGLTEDTLASSAFSPSGENEVQMRDRIGPPRFVGHHGALEELALAASATGDAYYKIGMNTWDKAQYILETFKNGRRATGATSGVEVVCLQPQPVWINPIALDRDADWDVKVAVTTASKDTSVMLYESYGAPIRPGGGMVIHRKVSASSDNTVDAWSTIGTITDLDPRKSYRVHSITPQNENASGIAVRVSSPSNSTYVGCLVPVNTVAPNPTIMFPVDSIVVMGVETITVEGYTGAAQKMSATIGFEELGGAPIRRGPARATGAPRGRAGGLASSLMAAFQSGGIR